MNKKLSIFLTLLCVLALAVPHMAEARAGGGKSSGSRGGRTFQAMPPASPYKAQPIERSATPTPQQAAPHPQTGPTAPSVAPAPAPSFFGAHPFLSSLAGGFLGMGLYNALFGHGAGGVGASGTGDMGLLPLLLIGGLIFFAVRWFKRRGTPMGMPASFPAMNMLQQEAPYTDSTVRSAQDTPLTIGDADYQTFQTMLEKIQTEWDRVDTGQLRQYLTPEMQHYFSQELAANTSRGLANKIENVKMLSGDMIEAWSEESMDYATVHLKWSAIDYMACLDRQPTDPDYVAEGSRDVPTEAQEVWTFVRAQNGGRWLLSAIQQVG